MYRKYNHSKIMIYNTIKFMKLIAGGHNENHFSDDNHFFIKTCKSTEYKNFKYLF